jgi:hypothetical protein
MDALRTIFLTLGVLTISISCETERLIFKGPFHVRFTESAGVEKESYSKPIPIEVHIAGPAPDRDITLSYTISGNAREGIDYVILGTRGSVKIQKGKYFGYIELQLINNANNIIRSQDVVFTLQSVDDNLLEVGQGSGGIGKSFTFTIIDDCILGGYYLGSRGAFSVPVRNITITSQNCETYRLSNWNINIFQFDDPLDLVFIDNFDNTITIPAQEEESFPEEFATIIGSGIVNPLTREIIINLTLVDFEGSPTVTFTLIPD